MGYGDEIMATAEAREAKKKFPNAKIVIGDGKKTYPSIIYLNNPNIYQGEISPTHNDEYIWIMNYMNTRPYIDYTKFNSERIIWDSTYSSIPGDIYFSKEENKNIKKIINKAIEIWENNTGKKFKYLVIVDSSVKSAKYTGAILKKDNFARLNRDWGFEKWQQVINSLKDEITFIQPFKGEVRKLSNVVNIECDFRVALAMINNSDLFIGHHGGLSHATAALNKPGVIIFGGWISPKITGYKMHEDLYIESEDFPNGCGSKIKCDHCNECMNRITTDTVLSKIMKFLKS